MNAAYELEVRRHCPNAAIVYDLFHVVAKYGREVIDRVRVDRANELRNDRRRRKVVKGARWLLLKNRHSLRPGEDVTLDELLAANHDLFVVYVLRDALRDLWSYRDPDIAARGWRSWYRKALRSGIEPLRCFARALRPYLPGIPCPLPLSARHQSDRGDQQPDQSHQADGLRLPRRRLLLPQDPGGLLRNRAMNLSWSPI